MTPGADGAGAGEVLLSLVVPSRNDSYMGNANWRLATTLDFWAAALDRMGRLSDAEIVVVDWGSGTPLYRALRTSAAGSRLARHIVVPPAVHEELRGDSDFPDVLAANAGIRRARGRYIGTIGNDLLLPEPWLARLFGLLEGTAVPLPFPAPPHRCLMVFPRRHVPRQVVEREPEVGELELFLAEHGESLPVERLRPFFLGPPGGVIMHRNLWAACHGYDEELIHWGANDINLNLRVALRHPVLDMDRECGLSYFHLQHYSSPGQKPKRREKVNPLVFGPFAVNGEGWGLAGRTFEEYPARTPSLLPSLPSPPDPGYRRRHLGRIARLAVTGHPWEGMHALIHFIKDAGGGGPLSRLLGHARLPRFLKRPPLYQRRFPGPWDR